jgi:capsular exopolysaccharide synthesis family protein
MKLSKTPLLEIVGKLEARKASGILEFLQPETQEKIYLYFYDGQVEAASSTRQETCLGQYLVRENLLNPEELAAILKRAQKAKKPLGEMLVLEDWLDPAVLGQMLTRQLVDLSLLAIKGNFLPGTFTGSTKGSMKHRLHMSCFNLTLAIIRRRSVQLNVKPGQRVLLVADAMPSAEWLPDEVSVISCLRYPISVEDLADKATLETGRVRMILQLLNDLELIAVIEGDLSDETALVRWERLPLEILVPEIRNSTLTEKVDLVNQNHSPVSEQFRSLKVRLGNQVDPPVKILSITSPRAQDGKSLISVNLAMSFAKEPGRRVLLIDCDLRGASIHDKLGVSMEPGLYHYLLEGLEPQCYLRRVGQLYVMTAGNYAPNAVDLLSLSRMQDLMEFGRREFDTVIIDAPPMLPVADARLITRLTDASIMVIYQGKTPYRMIRKALDLIDRRKLLGIVLNGVKATGLDGYYSYGYYTSDPYHSSDDVIELKAKPRRRGRPKSSRSFFG